MDALIPRTMKLFWKIRRKLSKLKEIIHLVTIADQNTSLSIQCDEPINSDIPYQVIITSGNSFSATCSGQFFIVNPSLHQKFLDFEALKLTEITIKTNCDGFIHLIRQSLGSVLLKYQFEDFQTGDVCRITGEVIIEGENMNNTLKELRETIFSKIIV